MKYPQILKTDINQPLLISCYLSLPFQHILAFGFCKPHHMVKLKFRDLIANQNNSHELLLCSLAD